VEVGVEREVREEIGELVRLGQTDGRIFGVVEDGAEFAGEAEYAVPPADVLERPRRGGAG
jgi:hypothetical protein